MQLFFFFSLCYYYCKTVNNFFNLFLQTLKSSFKFFYLYTHKYINYMFFLLELCLTISACISLSLVLLFYNSLNFLFLFYLFVPFLSIILFYFLFIIDFSLSLAFVKNFFLFLLRI